MPSFHKTIAGLFVAGAAGDGGVISTNDGRVVLGPSAGGDSRVGAQWYQDTHTVCQYFRREIDPGGKLDPRLVAIDVVNRGEPQLLWPDGTDKIVVGSGHWFAVTSHTGIRLDGQLIDFNVRAFAGEYTAWFPWNGTGLVIRGPSGDRTLSTALGPEEQIQLFDNGGCVWIEGGPRVDGVPDYPANGFVLDGGFGWFKILKINGEWWHVYQSYKLACVVAHPATKFIGNRWPAPDAFHLDVDPLTGFVIWSTTVADAPANIVLRQIDPNNVVDLTEPVPKITKVQYTSHLKAGEPWETSAVILGVTTRVQIDASQRLWWITESDGGTDHTGVVRQLAIEGPTVPPPEPKPMPALGRYWFQPNIASDMLSIFTGSFPPSFKIDVFCLYAQEILTDTPAPNLGQNIWPNLVAQDVVGQLKRAGIPLAIECGAVKNEDCTGQNYIDQMRGMVQRVADAGGEVAAFNTDDTMYNGRNCGTLEQLADRTANFIHAVRALGPIRVNILEAWPANSQADHETWLHLLNQRGALPDGYHPDIDWNLADQRHLSQSAFLNHMQTVCNSLGVMMGVFINSTKSPIDPDKVHHDNLVTLARRVQPMLPGAAHVHVASWAFRRDGGLQDVPSNPGEFGLLKTFDAVRTIFEPVQPQPVPEDDMYSKFIDPTLGVLAVKEIKPSATVGCSVLVLADFSGIDADGNPTTDPTVRVDKIASCQPGGTKVGWREPGTDGQWERCRVEGSTATFFPDGHYYTRTFAKVGGL